MTRKVYKSAQGKMVDLGALLLQNEQVRAVGNMNVNARGDLLDSSNRVIDQKNLQVQRQYTRQTNVSNSDIIATSTVSAKRIQTSQPVADATIVDPSVDTTVVDQLDMDSPVITPAEITLPSTDDTNGIPRTGLAAAIAKSREIKQELDKTPRQRAQEAPVRKI